MLDCSGFAYAINKEKVGERTDTVLAVSVELKLLHYYFTFLRKNSHIAMYTHADAQEIYAASQIGLNTGIHNSVGNLLLTLGAWSMKSALSPLSRSPALLHLWKSGSLTLKESFMVKPSQTRLKDQSPASSSFHWMTQITKSTVTAPTEPSASQEARTIQDPCYISALYYLLFIFRICTTMLTLYTNKKTLGISRWLTCFIQCSCALVILLGCLHRPMSGRPSWQFLFR
jgi:hypothetical protein